MIADNPLLKTFLVFFLGLLLAGCAVQSIHDESYFSSEITERTGH